MNKDDILARSRAENQGSDEYEKQILEKAGKLAAQVGMVACCMIAAVSVLVTERVNSACWVIYFSIYAGKPLDHRRRKHLRRPVLDQMAASAETARTDAGCRQHGGGPAVPGPVHPGNDPVEVRRSHYG